MSSGVTPSPDEDLPVPPAASDPPEPPPARPTSPFPLAPRAAYAAAVLSGLLYWLAFPGKLHLVAAHGLLALVAFIPMWLALQGQPPKRALWIGVLTGATMNVAGFTWLLDMLQTFSGFPWYFCIFFVLFICAYQGGRLGLMGWLYSRATRRGWPAATVFVAAFAVSEYVYPLLFPWYFAATTYRLPALSQTAELGGPILVGVILVGVNIALAEPLLARLEKRKPLVPRIVVPLVVLSLALLFAAIRIPQVDTEALAAEPVHVGVVQGNLGLIEKREDPAEGLRRHMRLTNDLKDKGVEFVLWSESSVTMGFPERGYPFMLKEMVTQAIGIPAIIGTVLFSDGPTQTLYNTALSIDAKGDVTGRYDKEYLLAFGEYLPLGELIPKLYEWSPNSGHFTPGTVTDPLPITVRGTTHPVTALICYEDILPSFTNRVVAKAKPDLLVSMSNDAWFGDTAEPWEHLALAQLSAIAHRRYLVRSTNSGVSAIIDPVGRVIVHGGTFESEALDTIVHWLHTGTMYESIGDAPWILLSFALVMGAFVRRKGSSIIAFAALLATACSSGSTSKGPDVTAGDATSDATSSSDDAEPDTSAPPTMGDAGPCPAIVGVDFGGTSCESCIAMSCCSTAAPCYAVNDAGDDPNCSLLANCLSDCEGADGDAGDSETQATCEAGCKTEYASALTAYDALESCVTSECTNDGGTGPCNE